MWLAGYLSSLCLFSVSCLCLSSSRASVCSNSVYFLKPLEIVKAGRDFGTIEGSRSSLLFCAVPRFALLRGPSTIVSRAGFRSIEGAFTNREVTLLPAGMLCFRCLSSSLAWEFGCSGFEYGKRSECRVCCGFIQDRLGWTSYTHDQAVHQTLSSCDGGTAPCGSSLSWPSPWRIFGCAS